MVVSDILLLGNPLLFGKSAEVERRNLSEAVKTGADLIDTMSCFRVKFGWGRAISAPQIGVPKRVILVNVDGPHLIINPEVSDPSSEMMEVWDDCMSFPDLLVKVRRHVSFSMTYRDDNWEQHSLHVEGELSELLQHEIDHLDGILAVSRAIDGNSFALQSERELIPGAVFANDPT